jgi:vacuolar-type H+-ATPase subunit E/Vma4
MSLETIEEKIRKDAEEEAGSIISMAEREAKDIIAKATSKADTAYASLLRTEAIKTEISCQQILSQARMDSRKTVRDCRDALVAECFSRAEESLRSVRALPEYEVIFRQLLEEALAILGTGTVEISVHPEDRQLALSMAEFFEGDNIVITLTGKTLESSGGMVLAAPELKMQVDNTFEAREERLRRVLITEISGILFPTGGTRT